MASPCKKQLKQHVEYKYIYEILKTISNDEEGLKEDVAEVCEKVLQPLVEKCKQRITKKDASSGKLNCIRKQFTDIYYSLKLHLVFHLGLDETAIESIQKLGRLLELTDEELNKLPDKECAIDPGSKLLEIFSDLAEHEHSRGSEDHANNVMKMAKYWFKLLNEKNRFRPKVLAKVSHDDQCFIGSSIAVNHFLKPLYLYNRITQFKWSLQKAIIFFEPLATADSRNWASSAFCAADYVKPKAPCQNCAKIFENLSGFINIGNLGGPKTFLANCAEFCPVNQLFLDSMDGSPELNEEMNVALRRYWNQCSILFDDFEKISNECVLAFESKDIKRLKYIYMQVINKVHIFGRKPECNGDLSKRHYYLRK